MISKKTLVLLPLLAVLALSTNPLLADWSSPPAQRLEGSWTYTATAAVPPGLPAPPVRYAFATFARGGAATGSDRAMPLGTQHGAWEHLHGDTFGYTFVANNFDPAGNFTGTLKVKSRITLTGADTFVGVGNAELRDAAGNLLFSACNTIRGERIRVEPLSAHCNSVMPPQSQ